MSRRPRPLAGAVALAAALALGGQTRAATDAVPRYELSGFGTLGVARLDVDGAEYRTGVAQDGADTGGSFAPDSRLGVQLDAELTPS